MFITLPEGKSSAPSAKRQAPSAKRQAPSAKRQAPSAKRQAPSAKRQAPSAKRQAPSAKRQAPSAKRQALILPPFIGFILFDSMLMLVVAGCEGRGVQGLPRARSLSAAEKVGGQTSLPLIPSEANLNLGQVAPGGRKSLEFGLTNRSSAPVQVVEITSSCDCLKVDLLERTLSPGQKVEGRIELDLRKEPQFLGNLGISVKGRGKKGETVFAMKVHVEVDND